MRKLMPRVYTEILEGAKDELVRDHLYKLLCHLFPGAVVSHRSALNPPTTLNPYFEETGAVYLTGTYTQRFEWPGVTVFLLKGPPEDEADPVLNPLPPYLRVSSFARAVLENMQAGRDRGKGRKSLERGEILSWLRVLMGSRGIPALDEMESEAHAVADRLGMAKEWAALQRLIGDARQRKGRLIGGWRKKIARIFPDVMPAAGPRLPQWDRAV